MSGKNNKLKGGDFMTAIAEKIDRIISNLNDIKRIHEVEIAGEAELVEFFIRMLILGRDGISFRPVLNK